jgi:hypothetical protein
MAKQATELRYAVRFRVVGKYFGQLCLALAALTLVPLVMSVIFGDTAHQPAVWHCDRRDRSLWGRVGPAAGSVEGAGQ